MTKIVPSYIKENISTRIHMGIIAATLDFLCNCVQSIEGPRNNFRIEVLYRVKKWVLHFASLPGKYSLFTTTSSVRFTITERVVPICHI